MPGAIFWFRKGLRLHDNKALIAAVESRGKKVYPVYVLDPKFVNPKQMGLNRLRFLLECLLDLDYSLRTKHNSRLIVLRGDPTVVIPEQIEAWDVDRLVYEDEPEPHNVERDEAIKAVLKESNSACLVYCTPGHTIWDPKYLLKINNGKPPLTMQSFTTLAEKKADPPARPINAPTAEAMQLMLPRDVPETDKAEGDMYSVPVVENVKDFVALYSSLGVNGDQCTIDEADEKENNAGTPIVKGGETEALKRLSIKVNNRHTWVATFAKPDTAPTAFDPPSTTILSPYLANGSISPRLFYYAILDCYEKNRKENGHAHTKSPTSLMAQLYWREFFTLCGRELPHFGAMVGNSICKQIPWSRDMALLRAWEKSHTGFPWIDSVMTQLRTTGWIHHLARHSVACFLTRGDLWVHWEMGRDAFERHLLDADWSLNNANWMWLSASGFFHQFYRVYSPIAWPKKTDPNGDHVRHFVPVLKDMPKKYIYEPWLAPLTVQKKANCIIGKDYPYPVVDHNTVKNANLTKMKDAYGRHSDGKINWEEDVAQNVSNADKVIQTTGIGEYEYVSKDTHNSGKRKAVAAPSEVDSDENTVKVEGQSSAPKKDKAKDINSKPTRGNRSKILRQTTLEF
ncbi:hypothetical protein SARC_05172 [Sphaeroforma arctica JP610]|uniref:Photolyase/cryptochrome alpha/beta domain-containing protein n=1 Tax=Sphaeroforma arctica JP610 TaxID=667725 RepID=A0A0L0G0E7_9EUKA|nr:hypothetical protein SARC_05172 [Sphaeroforma arctica JP610]KNC82545.1 hypothetical protein SARC_05172 [Sphaeroforma arctica JP610]|eukprot:XP_014156447.1 hypothetical protein SARC_05172 [Sphaeroforma arctica JP610]